MEGQDTRVCVNFSRNLKKEISLEYSLEVSTSIGFGELTIVLYCDTNY